MGAVFAFAAVSVWDLTAATWNLTPEAVATGFAFWRYGESWATVTLVIPLLAVAENAGTSKMAARAPKILAFIFVLFLAGLGILFTLATYARNGRLSVRLGLLMPYDLAVRRQTPNLHPAAPILV